MCCESRYQASTIAHIRSAATLDPYRVAQRLVVQDRPDMLLSQFANRLPELDDFMSPE